MSAKQSVASEETTEIATPTENLIHLDQDSDPQPRARDFNTKISDLEETLQQLQQLQQHLDSSNHDFSKALNSAESRNQALSSDFTQAFQSLSEDTLKLSAATTEVASKLELSIAEQEGATLTLGKKLTAKIAQLSKKHREESAALRAEQQSQLERIQALNEATEQLAALLESSIDESINRSESIGSVYCFPWLR
jgi:exonuclease VII small subunit